MKLHEPQCPDSPGDEKPPRDDDMDPIDIDLDLYLDTQLGGIDHNRWLLPPTEDSQVLKLAACTVGDQSQPLATNSSADIIQLDVSTSQRGGYKIIEEQPSVQDQACAPVASSDHASILFDTEKTATPVISCHCTGAPSLDVVASQARASASQRSDRSSISSVRSRSYVRESIASTARQSVATVSLSNDLESSVRDICVIVVGKGEAAIELARSRLAAGGRLILLWTAEPPSGMFKDSGFSWCPPKPVRNSFRLSCPLFFCKISRQNGLDRARQLFNAKSPRSFCKNGPDIVSLDTGERYEFAETVGVDSLGGVRVLRTDNIVWEVTGKVIFATSMLPIDGIHFSCDDITTSNITVERQCAKPLPMLSPRSTTGVMVWIFVFEFSALFLESYPLDLDGGAPAWKVHWWLGISPFFYGHVNNVNGLTLCGKSVEGELWNILSCAIGTTIFGCISCTPVGGNCYPTDFITCGLASAVDLIVCLPIHCVLVRRLPRYIPWFMLVISMPLGAWFVFYIVCTVFLFVSAISPVAGSVFLPIAVTTVESLSVLIIAYGTRSLYYHREVSGDQLPALVITVAIIHGFAENARLCGTLVKVARQGDYYWIISMLLSVCLNLSTRFGWSRLNVMRILHLFSPTLRDSIRPSLFTRVHNEVKFLMGYPRFVSPCAIMLVRSVRGMTPLNNASAVFVVIVCCVLECLEDFVVNFELLPYASPLNVFPSLKDEYRSTGRFDPFQCFTWSCARSEPPREEVRSTRPLLLHATRTFSIAHHAIILVPCSLFGYCLLQFYLGAGFVSGRCPEPIADPMSQVVLWERPLPC